MRIDASTTLRQMAFLVGTALEGAGVEAVLSGGGAASVYAPEAVQSHDLDFVLGFWSSMGVSARCVLDLGFVPDGGGYRHPASPFTLEFPQGPPMVGDEPVASYDTLREDGLALNILTPTDCVRDRLSWFLFYRSADYSALAQALAVVECHPIDLAVIEAWAVREGAEERYRVFEARCGALKREPPTPSDEPR